jgi:acetoin utilization deacetylase AcuC-like enzyme
MNRVRIYSHEACLRHDPGAGHPERPARLQAVTEALRAELPDLDWQPAPRASRSELLRVHDDALVARILDGPADTTRFLDPDTVLGPGSAEAALRAAGAGIAAVDAVLAGNDGIRRAFCAVRPPGHHATASTAMGFCLFNSIAVAAAHALDAHRLERVAVVDFDVHHGNGTQAIFEDDPRVMYLSSHQAPLYPGSGGEDERGVGNLVNAPLPAASNGAAFRAAWQSRLLPALESFRPQLMLLSAGFDAERRDPLAQLQLEAGDYHWLTVQLVAGAERHAHGRVVSMLEGGYDLDALRECSVAHVRALAGPQATAAAI